MSTVKMPAGVRDVAAELIRHPVRHFVFCWDWKSAVLSPLVRGTLILAANMSTGVAQSGALSVDAV